MKRNANLQFLSSLLKSILMCSLIFCATTTKASTKYALIVAIGNQPKDTRWNSTKALNDAMVIQQSLKKKGFDSLIVLTDQNATKTNILASLEQAIKSIKSGDVFVFYYAGHGQKIMDDNGDEIDGYDEALVAYGAPSEYDQWYNFESHIRDDVFSEIMDRLRSRLGEMGSCLVLIDAGFGNRSIGNSDSIRGGKAAYVSPGYINNLNFLDVSAGLYEDRPFGMPAVNYSPIVCISATRSDMVSREHNGNGLFTLAFDRAFESMKNGDSYYSLYVSMNNYIQALGYNQNAVLEGFYDRKIFDISPTTFSNANFTTLDGADLNALQALADSEQLEVRRFIMEQDVRIRAMF